MKKLIYLGLIIGMLFVGMKGVEADTVVCKYSLKYSDVENNTRSCKVDGHCFNENQTLTISYISDKEIQITFGPSTTGETSSETKTTYDNVLLDGKGYATLSTTGRSLPIYWMSGTNHTVTSSGYECPKYAFSSTSSSDGICFANEADDCLDSYDYIPSEAKGVTSKLTYDLSQGGDISSSSSFTEANDSFISELFDFDIGGCASYLGTINDSSSPAYYLHFAFNLLKYAAIILLFVLSIVEFGKAAASNKSDAIPGALKNTAKRAIIAVIIFFLPPLIELLFQIFGIYSSTHCVTGSVGVLNVIS